MNKEKKYLGIYNFLQRWSKLINKKKKEMLKAVNKNKLQSIAWNVLNISAKKLECQDQWLSPDRQSTGLMRLISHLRTSSLLHLFPESDNSRIQEQESLGKRHGTMANYHVITDNLQY